MFGTRAYELLKEFQRADPTTIPPCDQTTLRLIYEEMHGLQEMNTQEQQETGLDLDVLEETTPGVYLRYASLERNKQCVLAYLFNRLTRIRDLRWNFGSVIPEDTRLNLTEREIEYFKNYNKSLANYMRLVSGDFSMGFDLTQNIIPPKSGTVTVHILKDWEIEDEGTGQIIQLKKGSLACMDESQADTLARQAIVEITHAEPGTIPPSVNQAPNSS